MFGLMTKPQATGHVDCLTVAGRQVDLAIIEHPRATRLTLRIRPDGGLRVTVPLGTHPSQIDRFLARQNGWLEEKLANVPDKPQVRAGIRLPILGVNHTIVHRPGRGVTEARPGDGGPELIVRGDPVHLPRRVADHLKKSARAHMAPLIARHTAAIGQPAKSVSYRDTTSRWGSCSSAGNLSFCWRIVMAPPTVVDYLVAHEVAHLRHMNHGRAFWALCEELCPQTPQAKAWLKRNGSKLQAIRF